MAGSDLYWDDILLWSEQQGGIIRNLKHVLRDLPDDLDLENVAEEIESAGRTELVAVQSCLRSIFLHTMKFCAESTSDRAGDWRGEIVGFHSNLRRRYAPSMRQRIDMDAIWRSTREQMMLSYPDAEAQFVAGLPDKCPMAPDDLFGEQIDVLGMIERVRQSAASASG